MRNLFLFFLLVALLAFSGPPTLEPVTAAAFLFISSLLASGFSGRVGLPPFIGALAIGALVAHMDLFPISAIHPFFLIAAAWIGLHLGSSIYPSSIRNRTLVLAACSTIAGAFLTTFPVAIVLGVAGHRALPLAIVASCAAPVFYAVGYPGVTDAPGSDRRRSLPLLITAMALSLWALYACLSSQGFPFDLLGSIGLVALWLAAMEGVYRSLNLVRTRPGRAFLISLASVSIWIAANAMGVHPLFAGMGSGFLLSLRSGRQRRALDDLALPAGALAAFATAYLGATIQWGALASAGSATWAGAVLLTLVGLVGKTVGGLLGHRSAERPFREGSGVLPQGLIGCTLLAGGPAGGFEPGFVPAFLLLAGVGVWLLLRPLEMRVRRRESAGEN